MSKTRVCIPIDEITISAFGDIHKLIDATVPLESEIEDAKLCLLIDKRDADRFIRESHTAEKTLRDLRVAIINRLSGI